MNHRTERTRAIAILEALATVCIWGATFVATKVALKEVSPATVVWLRFTMGVAVLAISARYRKQIALPAPGQWPVLFLLGFIGVALHQWLQSNGLRTAAATTTAWLVATTPIFIALLGSIALGENMSVTQWAGVGLGALGVLAILSKGDLAALHTDGQVNAGDVLVMLSAPNWAIYTILSRRVLSNISPSKMIFYVMVAGWMFITVWAFGFGPGVTELGALTTSGWLAVTGLGVFGSGLAYIMYHDALHAMPASQLGVFLNLEPLATMLLAAPILDEPLTAIVLVGGCLIFGGIFLVNRRIIPKGDADPPSILPPQGES